MRDYPLQDHRKVAPQPEVCEICGMPWPGGDMRYADIEGIRGKLVCGSPKTRCNHFRQAVTYKDRYRMRRRYGTIGSGKHPIFPPGAGYIFETLTEAEGPYLLLEDGARMLLESGARTELE